MGFEKDLERAVDDLWDEQLLFLKTLGSFKSTSGQERGIQLFLEEYFNSMNLAVDAFDVDDESISKYNNYGKSVHDYKDRPVVVGVKKGKREGKGRSLILQAHADVVPEGPESHWHSAPYSPVVKDKKMYGRGLLDMKGGLAANVFAVKALEKAGVELDGDLQLQTVIEEEITGNGALALLDKGYTADAALIPEPTHHRILTAQVGVLYMKITVIGQGAHVERADQAQNAIETAYKVIDSLDKYRAYINNEERHPAYKEHAHPLNVNVGTIKGGEWTGSVPVECSMEVRVGFYPGIDPEDVKEEITEWIHDDSKNDEWLKDHLPAIEFFGFSAPGFDMGIHNTLHKTLSLSHEQVTGEQAASLSFTATTDVRAYDEFGIPVTCYGPEGDNMHAPNEYIDLDSLKQTTEVIAHFIKNWCND